MFHEAMCQKPISQWEEDEDKYSRRSYDIGKLIYCLTSLTQLNKRNQIESGISNISCNYQMLDDEVPEDDDKEEEEIVYVETNCTMLTVGEKQMINSVTIIKSNARKAFAVDEDYLIARHADVHQRTGISSGRLKNCFKIFMGDSWLQFKRKRVLGLLKIVELGCLTLVLRRGSAESTVHLYSAAMSDKVCLYDTAIILLQLYCYDCCYSRLP